MLIQIAQAKFDPLAALAEQQNSLAAEKSGANSIFIGTMRDFNDDNSVEEMFLEYYPGMTEKVINELCSEAQNQWAINELLLIHRVGKIKPGEAIVLIAVWTAHRQAAFEACRYLIEALKSRAPFWKKETLANSERWVEKNT